MDGGGAVAARVRKWPGTRAEAASSVEESASESAGVRSLAIAKRDYAGRGRIGRPVFLVRRWPVDCVGRLARPSQEMLSVRVHKTRRRETMTTLPDDRRGSGRILLAE